jgi:hypothetical protein
VVKQNVKTFQVTMDNGLLIAVQIINTFGYV